MTSNIREFSRELVEITKTIVPKKALALQRQVALELFGDVLSRTPVDIGRARANWQLGLGTLPSGVKAGADASNPPSFSGQPSTGIEQSPTYKQIAAEIQKAQPYGVMYLANNLPYILVLERGGFLPPDPPEDVDAREIRRRRRNDRQRRRAKGAFGDEGATFVSSGYSKQAARGMVSIAVVDALPVLREAAARINRSGGAR